MKIELKKIKRVYYDYLYNDVISNMNKYVGNDEMVFYYDDRKMTIEDMSESVLVNGSPVFANIDISEQINKLNSRKVAMRVIDFKISKILFVALNSKVPRKILYENEFWTYLSHTIFKDYIIKRYFYNNEDSDDEDQKDSIMNKIRRYFFSSTTQKGASNLSSRIGLKFLYSLVDLTYDDREQFKLTELAHRFIDPVKAIYERQIGKNKMIIKSFVKAIEINNYDHRIRSTTYRTKIPTHISNFASVNLLDAYDYNELSKLIAKEQTKILML